MKPTIFYSDWPLVWYVLQIRNWIRRFVSDKPETGVLLDNRLRFKGPVEPEARLRWHSRIGGRADERDRRRWCACKSRRTRHRPDDRHVRARCHSCGPLPRRWWQDWLRPVIHAAGHVDQFGIELFERRFGGFTVTLSVYSFVIILLFCIGMYLF